MRTETGLAVDGLVVEPFGAPLLAGASLVVPRGASLALLGDAGTGKSTVLAVLAARRKPDGGTVRFDDAPVDPTRVGFADQQHELPDGLTSAEHLTVPLLVNGVHPDGWSEIEALLTSLGLPESAHHNLLEELSGGQQQRVALARALVTRPPLICIDDPVSELDAVSAQQVWTVLDAAVGDGAVLVVATPRAEDADRFDHVLRLG